jgi:hypothetical protein
VGKTVCEKTSLLPRSCAVSSHLAAVSVSPLTCGSPAIGKGSISPAAECLAISDATADLTERDAHPIPDLSGSPPAPQLEAVLRLLAGWGGLLDGHGAGAASGLAAPDAQPAR